MLSYRRPSRSPVPFFTAFSMVSLGMLAAFASSMAYRSVVLNFGSPPPLRAATMIARLHLLHTLPRLASFAAFLCLMFFHALWPAMILSDPGTPTVCEVPPSLSPNRLHWGRGPAVQCL